MALLSFFTTEKIGKTREKTPEGYLLCRNVPIARTGVMEYVGDELPMLRPGDDGMIRVLRTDDEVFAKNTIASFQGKAVTIGHPVWDVTPENWEDLAHGTALNVRRGEGAEDDLLLADLLVTTDRAIKAIEDGTVEVSCGYNADYEDVEPGKGIQRNIVGNHVALVEAGRCGSRCSIGDQATVNKEAIVPKSKKSWLSRMAVAIKTGDEAAQSALLEEMGAGDEGEITSTAGGEGETHIHVHVPSTGEKGAGPAGSTVVSDEDEPGEGDLESRLQALEAGHKVLQEGHQAILAKLDQLLQGKGGDEEPTEAEAKMLQDEAPEEEAEKAPMAKDSALYVKTFKETQSLAEILVPGIQLPTYDRAAKPLDTVKTICNLRRKTLDMAYVRPETRDLIDAALGGRSLDTKAMTCDTIRNVFRSAATMRQKLNASASAGRSTMHDGKPTTGSKAPKSLADLNAANKAMWDAKAPK